MTETTLTTVSTAIDLIEPGRDLDHVAYALDKFEFIKSRVREEEARLKERLIAYIESLPEKEFQIGTRRYYVAPDKKVKDNDVKRTTEAVFQAVGGSIDDFCCYLSSNAFKPGACKKLLAEQFDSFFTTTITSALKSDGTYEKDLQIVDDRFVR